MVRFAVLLPLMMLASCGDEPEPQAEPVRDPQVAQALNDPLMTDPDLSLGNEGAAALTVQSDFSLPVLPATSEEIAQAKAEAADIVGGADKLVPLPGPRASTAPLAIDAGPADRLAARLGPTACRDKLQSSAIWAARLPAAMPIYPRAHTLDAAGSDAKGCKVRTVAFSTPVPRDEVLAFYVARAKALGARGPGLTSAGDDLRIIGTAGGLAYDVFARSVEDHTLVRLTVIER